MASDLQPVQLLTFNYETMKTHSLSVFFQHSFTGLSLLPEYSLKFYLSLMCPMDLLQDVSDLVTSYVQGHTSCGSAEIALLALSCIVTTSECAFAGTGSVESLTVPFTIYTAASLLLLKHQPGTHLHTLAIN